jgi:hypothetical protein
MPNSYTEVTSAGEATYTAPAYISKDHITVLVDSVSKSFTWDSASIVRPDVTPTSGQVVRVQRTTPTNAPLATLTDGAVDSASAYNTIALQMLYSNQEYDELATGPAGADSDMLKATYDPTSVAGDAFDMDNMVEGTNLILSAAERSKLSGIEAAADVTDTANVTAAGALMDSEVDADLKTLVLPANTTISAFGASLIDDAAASNARTTLGLGSAAVLAETTAAEFRNNTADRALSTDQVWSAAAEVTLTDAATIAVDMDSFINAKVTLAGNRTLGNPTNEKVGQSGVIRVIQDATGSRTLAYGTDWEFAGGTAPTLSTAANAEDLLFYHVIAADRVLGQLTSAIA